jgi:Transcriptional activator of glycolytic enzymes
MASPVASPVALLTAPPIAPPTTPPAAPPAFQDVSVSTVKQAWQQWKDGYGGNLPVEQLERDWGAQWRPEARMRQWFSRRKVIWDRLREIIDAGQTPDAAIDQLEQIRKGKSLHQLGKLLKQPRVQGHV